MTILKLQIFSMLQCYSRNIEFILVLLSLFFHIIITILISIYYRQNDYSSITTFFSHTTISFS